MKQIFTFKLCFLFSILFTTANAQQDDWQNQAQAFIKKRSYFFTQHSSSFFTCGNTAQHVAYSINEKGYSMQPMQYSPNGPQIKWSGSFSVLNISKGEKAFMPIAKPKTTCKEGYLLQNNYNYSVEYTNYEEGLKQDFIIVNKPQGNKALTLQIQLHTKNLTLKISGNDALELDATTEKTILKYDALKVLDAKGTTLSAHMKLSTHDVLEIIVDDNSAQYPVTIDPLSHTAEWSGTAEGILPTVLGQLAVDATYGFTVAGVGDVNGDGYADIAIGAPNMADVITGSGTLAGVGAVFVYYGGHSGLSTTPNAELQPSTAVAGALFGYSITGGDLNNDGKSDIVVGAPLDKITLSTGGSGTVGKVYVFNGGSLGATTITPLLTLQLNGLGIIKNGVNLSVNALFGFSVAITDDLNNDGFKDIVVGSPAYVGINVSTVTLPIIGTVTNYIADVQSGGAFMFLSSNSESYSLQKLTPPAQSLLGLGLISANVTGLLFGYSVDGVGDYNGDGYPDVAVGAPAGVDLSSLGGLLNGQLLQGSVLIYYGNNAGTATQPGATLVASAGGLLTNLSGTLSNLANLFGYSVRGVRTTTGVRNGNILVGAPLGGTLTNLLGGLQVKTGTVSVFVKQPGASGTIAPTQQLSSPRNSNTILNLIQSSLLFGFSLDNVNDVNCDGINDIVVGEPASSGAQLVAANVAGGSAYVFFGKSDGTYQTSPGWSLVATYDATLGVNAASLIGYSVAGAGKVTGVTSSPRILVGTPGRTLDFGSGLLNLGNTLGTLFGLVAGNNGVGKAYTFDTQICNVTSSLPLIITDFNAVPIDNSKVLVSWKVSTERNVNAYIAERSTNGITWETLGLLPADPNSDTSSNFAITDYHPYSGISYYRMKQEDLDNTLFYTNIKAVDFNTTIAGRMTINNPFNSFITIQLTATQENNAEVQLFDLNGKLLHSQAAAVTSGLNTIQINSLASLAKGIYLVRIINGTENYTSKLIKQ
jgi:hypothetical protein